MDFAEQIARPISEDAPAGADVRGDEDYDALQGEIDKLSLVTAEGGAPNWAKVVELGTSILAEKSKHLMVAAYLGAGLVETRGVQGLAEGVEVFVTICREFWDGCFPPKKRMRGRLNAIGWFMERAESFMRDYDGPELEPELVSRIQDGFGELDEILAENAGDDAPVLSRLREMAGRLPVKAAEPEPAAETAAEPAPEPPPGPTPEPAQKQASAEQTPAPTPGPAAHAPPSGPVQDERQAMRQIDQALATANSAGRFLLEADPSRPEPYRLNRAAAWWNVDAPPPAEEGQTMIPAPDSSVRQGVEMLISGRDYESAVKQAESLVGQYLFWLDISRLSFEALTSLGGKYELAAEEVARETVAFATRLPGITGLAFADGTPFADQRTKAWLAEHSPGQSAAPQPGGGDDETAKVIEEALDLAKKKKTLEAVHLVEAKLHGTDSGRTRLVWRIGLVRILGLAGRIETVRPHVDAILADIDAYHLEDWDPELALSGLVAAQDHLAAEKSEERKALSAEVLGRIARLDATTALRLLG